MTAPQISGPTDEARSRQGAASAESARRESGVGGVRSGLELVPPRVAQSPDELNADIGADVDAAAKRMERLAAHVRPEEGFDNWDVFPNPPPGTGIALADVLEAGCQGCGGALHAEAPFKSLAALVLVGFCLPAADREQLDGIVEVHCRSCGYVGSAQQ